MNRKHCDNLAIPVLLFMLIVGSSQTVAESTSESAVTTASKPNAIYSTLQPDLDLLGRWYGGPVYASVVSGKYVYFGTGGGIRVLKIKKSRGKKSPSWDEVAVIESSGVIRGLDVSGKYLYVADNSGALRVIDVSKPKKPRERGHVELPTLVRAISVEGKYAYLATGWRGLTIIDISDPDQPRFVKTLGSIGYMTDIHVTGSMAVMAGHDVGLKLLDVSDPLQPAVIGHHEMPGQPHGVYVHEQRAYVVSLELRNGDNAGGLTIFDISNPSAPRFLSFEELIYGAERVWVEGSYAYLAAVANDAGLIIVDVSDPTEPLRLGSYTSSTWQKRKNPSPITRRLMKQLGT